MPKSNDKIREAIASGAHYFIHGRDNHGGFELAAQCLVCGITAFLANATIAKCTSVLTDRTRIYKLKVEINATEHDT